MRLLMSFNGLRGKSLLAVVGTLGGLLLITSCKANLWDRCRDTGDGDRRQLHLSVSDN